MLASRCRRAIRLRPVRKSVANSRGAFTIITCYMFPQNAALWENWIDDEIALRESETGLSMDDIGKLFERALNDYYCKKGFCFIVPIFQAPLFVRAAPRLWLKYCEFGTDHVRDWIVARDIFEKAIAASKCDAANAGAIASAQRQFELAMLSMLEAQQPVMEGDEATAGWQEFVRQEKERMCRMLELHASIPAVGESLTVSQARVGIFSRRWGPHWGHRKMDVCVPPAP